MSATAIKAGKAWVELALKDKTDSGLANAQRKFLRWGLSLGKVGTIITGAASTVLGSLVGMGKVFADAGSEIFDLSRSTGVGAKELSALGYAAEQSGADLGAIGKSMVGLAKFTQQVNSGNKKAVQTLDQLGISSAAFLAATPYQRLLLVADGEKRIGDESLRLALRMKVLGKSGLSLGSLMADGAAGIQQLVGEAEMLGLTITPEEAKRADALGDAWAAVGKQFKQIAFVVGSAVAESLTAIFTAMQPVLAGTIGFIRNNQGLIIGLATGAVIAAAAGAAILSLAGASLLAGAAIKILTLGMAAYTAITTFAAAATAAVFTPVGLVIASVVLLGGAVAFLAGRWLYFSAMAHAAIGGVYDAIISGNWGLAGEIIMAAFNVAWQSGIFGLKALWIDFESWFYRRAADLFRGLATVLPEGRLKGAAGALAGVYDMAGSPQAQQQATFLAASKITEAVAELARLRGEAARLREEKFSLKLPKLPDLGGLAGGSPLSPGFAAGTFNAAAARLLGSAGESPDERTAKASEAALDKLDDIKGALEELDFADAD
jgi:hypothetical protein